MGVGGPTRAGMGPLPLPPRRLLLFPLVIRTIRMGVGEGVVPHRTFTPSPVPFPMHRPPPVPPLPPRRARLLARPPPHRHWWVHPTIITIPSCPPMALVRSPPLPPRAVEAGRRSPPLPPPPLPLTSPPPPPSPLSARYPLAVSIPLPFPLIIAEEEGRRRRLPLPTPPCPPPPYEAAGAIRKANISPNHHRRGRPARTPHPPTPWPLLPVRTRRMAHQGLECRGYRHGAAPPWRLMRLPPTPEAAAASRPRPHRPFPRCHCPPAPLPPRMKGSGKVSRPLPPRSVQPARLRSI